LLPSSRMRHACAAAAMLLLLLRLAARTPAVCSWRGACCHGAPTRQGRPEYSPAGDVLERPRGPPPPCRVKRVGTTQRTLRTPRCPHPSINRDACMHDAFSFAG
jgi:hypothetical protein